MRFSALRRLLSDLGLREVPVKKPFIGFQHQDDPDAWFVFPSYRGNARVKPHHLAQARVLLDGKGLMEADEFDRLVGAAPPMLEPRMTFSALRRLLTGLGFREVPVKKLSIGFEHQDDPDAWFVFPAYRGNSRVAPRHLAVVRVQLDGWGLMEADEFDRLVGAAPSRHPAPR
jgi:hypothetical protein